MLVMMQAPLTWRGQWECKDLGSERLAGGAPHTCRGQSAGAGTIHRVHARCLWPHGLQPEGARDMCLHHSARLRLAGICNWCACGEARVRGAVARALIRRAFAGAEACACGHALRHPFGYEASQQHWAVLWPSNWCAFDILSSRLSGICRHSLTSACATAPCTCRCKGMTADT
jgi:hypothetical protein